MTQPMKHTAADGTRMGLKARIQGLLKERSENPELAAIGLTIGQISAALSLPKTDHPSLSAALVKLRGEGSVKTVSGPSTSALGRRFVKLYLWRHRPEKAKQSAHGAHDDRRFLSFHR